MDIKTAAAYIRVSTDDQTEYSPDAQLRELRDYAAAHNLILDDRFIYADEGISGRKADKRPAFQEMVRTAKLKDQAQGTVLCKHRGRFSTVLCKHRGRFSVQRHREPSPVHPPLISSSLRKEAPLPIYKSNKKRDKAIAAGYTPCGHCHP